MKDYTYGTSSLDLAAFLSIQLKSPDEVKKVGLSNRFTFYFTLSSEAEMNELNMLVEEYWSGTRLVEPKAYFGAIKSLKNRLYNQENK